MTTEQESHLQYTIAHFQEVARQNRFAENASVPHDTARCTICHPELLSLEPFAVYLDVVIQSIKVRRPRLDQALVDEINKDLKLMGVEETVSLQALIAGDDRAILHWTSLSRDAISTGLGLLSVHSDSSEEFYLEEEEEAGRGDLIQEKIMELMDYQRENC